MGLGLLPSESTAQTADLKKNRSDATQSLSFFIFEQEQQKYWFVVEVLGIPNV